MRILLCRMSMKITAETMTYKLFPLFFCAVGSLLCDESHDQDTSQNQDDSHNQNSSHRQTDISMDLYHVALRIIDKSGKSYLLELPKGKAVQFKTLTLTAHRIVKNRKQDPDDILADIEIEEFGKTIFRNWISAANPAVNMLEHPIYLVHINFS